MSRTYRKRQDKFYWTQDEYERDGWSRWHSGKDYYAIVAKYYSDSERGMWQIPKHWKKDFRIRPFRSAERMCLRKEMQAVERGNLVYPHKKDHDEYYW